MSGPVRIEVEGLRVMCRVGVTDEELEVARAVVMDIEVRDRENRATSTDAIEDTVDYAGLVVEAERIATSEPHRTLERLAMRIATRIGEDAPPGARVSVRVAKPDPPMPQPVNSVAVTVALQT